MAKTKQTGRWLWLCNKLPKLTDKPVLYISHGVVPTNCDDDEKVAADDGNDDDDDSAHK